MQVNGIAQAVLFSFLLILVSIQDMEKREIAPDYCMAIAFCALLNFQVINLLGIGIAITIWITATWICPEQLGGGDIKLIAAASLVLGFTATAYGIIIGFMLELTVFTLIKHNCQLTKQEAKDFPMPLVPFLSIGFLTTFFMNLGGLMI